MTDRWDQGEVILRREVLGFEPTGSVDPGLAWYGQSWLDVPVRVVEDNDDTLVTYLPGGAPLVFPQRPDGGPWPSPEGFHPWSARQGNRWEGHGCLMVHRHGDHHATWHFWDGPERRFTGWYINLQTAFRRTATGFDTMDLELDLVVAPDRTWQMKDWDIVDDRVAEGRFTAELAAWVRELGTGLGRELDAGRHWWDDEWASWVPPAGWDMPPG